MLAIVPSATVLGVEGRPVSVEVHVSNGLPSFTIVGLPDTACREARDRVRAALLCTGLPWPMRRITVNLAPSGLRKVGSGLDLAIAVAMLVAEDQVEPAAIEGLGFLGELGLDGSLRAVPGMVSLVEALPTATAVVPAAAAAEARLVARHEVRAVRNLGEVVAVLKAEDAWPDPPPPGAAPPPPPDPDLADVRGQPVARLALEVAAAGHHHLLMVGPPGSGKTMLARRLPGLLPELSQEHALEVTRIHSAAGLPLRTDRLIWRPPLRAPHHNASPVSVIGGGTALMRPGEVSLAHPTVDLCSMSSTPRNAAIYCRISADPNRQALGVARQEEDCRKRAAELGWGVKGVYVDNDVSAYSGKRRPEYERLLVDLEAGVVDGVIAWHADRLYRRMGDLLLFIKVVDEAGASVQTVTSGDLDLSSGDGRLVAKIVAATAEHESDRKSERARRKHQELALAGKGSGGGTRPFGFEEDRITHKPDEAELVKAAVARILAGGTLRGICREWNDTGVATVSGGRWAPGVLKRILTSARIAGWREYKGEMVAEAEWDGIISRGDLERLRSILNDPGRLTRTYSRKYLLTGGLARCGLCGSNLVARPRNDGRRSYVCASDLGGCGKIRSLADPLEEAVERMVRQALDGPELWREVEAAQDSGGGSDDVAQQIREDEARLVELADDYYVQRIIKKPAFFAARDKLEERLARNQALFDQEVGTKALDAVEGRTEDLEAMWEELPFDRRRAIVGAVMAHVDLKPAIKGQNFFNPARLSPVWRFGEVPDAAE